MAFDEVTDSVLRGAGWFPGRRVATAPWVALLGAEGIEVHDAADAFLRELGGVTVDAQGPGITRSREPFAIDPCLCTGEGDRFLEWSADIGRRLVPVGELDRGRFFLGIDETGELYAVEAFLATFGTMPVAMDRLVLGVMPTDVTDRRG